MSGLINSLKKAATSAADAAVAAGNAGNLQLSSQSDYPDDSTVPDMRFSITPLPAPPSGVAHPVPTNPPTSSDSGFHQWHSAMKLVAQLPEGIPPEFRGRLWLALADRHLAARRIDWKRVERNCFSEWSHPSDAELGVQIVKDLHRTGCSLFCGEDGVENQALLKKVLLAYARWNKSVGYCQGFNMLAALILQVTDRNESDALKLMIYLIEGVLPDSYFADSLRGLSVDMAVFRELLRTKLPKLSKHLDSLQLACKEGSTSYEPPLTNVFTMQWFLTLFCNCLPQKTVLRVWDLILLEGNEILLRTALAIWQVLAGRIMTVRSADEFYCMMGVLMREILDNDLASENALITAIVNIGKLTELKNLREHYLYNINPWGGSIPRPPQDKRIIKQYSKEKLALDIGVLKKQYVKLKQRQRQAHIIFSAAVARQPTSTRINNVTVATTTPVAMNHLLLGKSALTTVKRLGPLKGSIPPIRQPPTTLLWKDTGQDSSSSDSSDTELCDNSDEDNKSQQLDDLPPDDNQTKSDTSILSNLDNTDERPLQQIPLPDVLNASKVDVIDIPSSISRSDSTESVDFEKFLAERVRDLKDTDSRSSEMLNSDAKVFEANQRVLYSRRNSQRALEIIQENSMILHRILQCQSRLSSSPEPDAADLNSVQDDLLSSPTEFATTSMDDNIASGMEANIDLLYITPAIADCLMDHLTESLTPINEEKSQFCQTPIDLPLTDAYTVKTEEKQCQNLEKLEDAKADIAVADFLQNYKHLFEKPSIILVPESTGQQIDVIKSTIDEVLPKCLDEDYVMNKLSPMEIKSNSEFGNAIRIKSLDKDNIKARIDLFQDITRNNLTLLEIYNKGQSVTKNDKSLDVDDSSISPSISPICDLSLTNSNNKPNSISDNLEPISSSTETIKCDYNEEEADYNLEKYRSKLGSPIVTESNAADLIEIDKNSKYNSIIAYSRNLDEKFNNLILNSPKMQKKDKRFTMSFDLTDSEPFPNTELRSSQSFTDFQSSTNDLVYDLGNKKQRVDKIDEVGNTDEYVDIDLNDSQGGNAKIYQGSCITAIGFESPNSSSSGPDSPLRFDKSQNRTKYTLNMDTLGESSGLKSPNRIYNPFPVSISSRQNKERAVQLGLYKK